MIRLNAPKSHPRYLSNFYRDILTDGFFQGITAPQGLIAHGRGEMFDYLIGEKTCQFAINAINAASALLLLAKHPVISVNGNTTILVPKELIKLSKILDCNLEVNLFHPYPKNREKKIASYLMKHGATKILLPRKLKTLRIESNRRFINEEGQAKADVVFVPLEDGDRTEALILSGKKVITVDLNPLSRTAQKATITIVDNIVRVMPSLIKQVEIFKKYKKEKLQEILKNYDNRKILSEAVSYINKRLQTLALQK